PGPIGLTLAEARSVSFQVSAIIDAGWLFGLRCYRLSSRPALGVGAGSVWSSANHDQQSCRDRHNGTRDILLFHKPLPLLDLNSDRYVFNDLGPGSTHSTQELVIPTLQSTALSREPRLTQSHLHSDPLHTIKRLNGYAINACADRVEPQMPPRLLRCYF